MKWTRYFASLLWTVAGWSATDVRPDFSGEVSQGHVPLAGAIVTLSGERYLKSVSTDASGHFKFPSVPPAHYQLRITAPGYALYQCTAAVEASHFHHNRISIRQLVPVDRQVASVEELRASYRAPHRLLLR